MRTHRQFTSHSWVNSAAVERLVWLPNTPPCLPAKDRPLPVGRSILAAVYPSNSNWIDDKTAFAQHGPCLPRPIVTIKLLIRFRESKTVQQRAVKKLVGRNTDSVVEPIRDVT